LLISFWFFMKIYLHLIKFICPDIRFYDKIFEK